MKKSESTLSVVKSIATIAFIGGAVAAFVFWTRRPSFRSHRLIGRCDDALNELEHRAPEFELHPVEHYA
ncbi:MAG: hypothetical protein P4L46_06390 [Fimbriimonas sp.]|nr:hypothetical protein [Fimbriimonas sp.]